MENPEIGQYDKSLENIVIGWGTILEEKGVVPGLPSDPFPLPGRATNLTTYRLIEHSWREELSLPNLFCHPTLSWLRKQTGNGEDGRR